ncbi:MAG: hypothetical protein QM817_27585 [Archangium sp.]
MNRLLLLLALISVSGCMCVQVPDVRFACESSSECLSGETCLGRHCVAVNSDASVDAGSDEDAGVTDAGAMDAGEVDAGPVDAGTADAGPDAGDADAGAPDAGDDAGTTDAGFEDCTNKIDDDGDTFIDCQDDKCRGQTCRPAVGVCDVAERCNILHQCPTDQFVASNPVTQCEAASGLHTLERGTSCTTSCGVSATGTLFREVPDSGTTSFTVFSRPDMDGGTTCDVCADFHVVMNAGINECAVPMLSLAVSTTPQPGLVPVFQFRSTSGPDLSAFGLDAGAPPSGFGGPVPVFWACPP